MGDDEKRWVVKNKKNAIFVPPPGYNKRSPPNCETEENPFIWNYKYRRDSGITVGVHCTFFYAGNVGTHNKTVNDAQMNYINTARNILRKHDIRFIPRVDTDVISFNERVKINNNADYPEDLKKIKTGINQRWGIINPDQPNDGHSIPVVWVLVEDAQQNLGVINWTGKYVRYPPDNPSNPDPGQNFILLDAERINRADGGTLLHEIGHGAYGKTGRMLNHTELGSNHTNPPFDIMNVDTWERPLPGNGRREDIRKCQVIRIGDSRYSS